MRALLGGMAAIGVVALAHSPSARWAVASTGGAQARQSAECGGAGYICGAVSGLSDALRNPNMPIPRADILPSHDVPGAVDPAVTQANIDATICRPGYAGSARPAYAITRPLKRTMMTAQHPGESLRDYELDHLIPISIGGAPLDRRDLWLQPRQGQANAAEKNVLAYVLWGLVCEHQLPLVTAQQAISRDWTKAYTTYVTPETVAKYHFRHSEDGPEERKYAPILPI